MNNLDIINCTNDNTPEFSLCGLTLEGRVLSCYDADTCKIALPLQNTFYKFTCRLNGIDTPEMKPRKDKPNREQEIVWAKKARSELLRLMCDDTLNSNFDNLDIKKEEVINILSKNKKLIKVKCLEWDKYGRLLVELYNKDDTKTFNDILVEKNLAVKYDGGTKVAPWI
jgi:endonuclease YncB( thermonuclease family)